MKRNQYLSMNLASLMLALLLWQAQVKGETRGPEREKSEGKPKAESGGEPSQSVIKGQQRRNRGLSAMRRRALIYEPVVAAAAARYKVDPRALWTLAYLETRFRANLTSPKGARGLMQMMPGTGARFNLQNPYNANESIDAAAQYLAILTNQFNGRLDLALAAYNSGEGAVDCYLNGKTTRTRNGKLINPRGVKTNGVPPYKETQAYVRRGLLVYARVASAGIFSADLVAPVRVLQAPASFATAWEVASVNNDLAELGGSPAFVGTEKAAAPTVLASAALSSKTEQGFETVFFDVNSGARYLVKSGQIVKPLEAVADETSDKKSASGVVDKEPTRSVYFSSRE